MYHFYNQSIKFYNQVFMELFNNLYIRRKDKDIKVPIEWIDKRKEETLRQENPDNVFGKTATFPRMGFRLTGLEYASSRNKNKLSYIKGTDGITSNRKPYDFSYDLSIRTKNLDDMYEIVEQILYQFDPYLEIDVVDNEKIGIESNIVIDLVSNSLDSSNIGLYQEEQLIEATLSFRLKGYLYGKSPADGNIIKTVILNFHGNEEKLGTSVVTEEGIEHSNE